MMPILLFVWTLAFLHFFRLSRTEIPHSFFSIDYSPGESSFTMSFPGGEWAPSDASQSVFSFPAIPVWLGIQYNSVTIDPLDLWQLSGFLISTMHRFFGV